MNYNAKYVVRLTEEERAELQGLVRRGKVAAAKRSRAQVLLKADAGLEGSGSTDEQVAQSLEVSTRSVNRVRKAYVEEGLSAAIKRQQGRSPLEPVSIIVPNKVVEQFLRYRVAESLGIAANLRFPFLRSYLAKQIESIDSGLKILDADDLQIILFECIRSARHRNDPELKPVRDYVEAGSKSASDIELRTLLFAGHMAQLFREYSISRRPMLRRWGVASSTAT